MLHVIQNGSLLRVDGSFESYDVYDHYCLEFDEEEDALTAIVCEFDDMLFKVNRAQAMIFATCMIISVPVRNQLIKIIVTHDAGWVGPVSRGSLNDCLSFPFSDSISIK